MKIGIDARMYGPRNGGIGRYVQQLVDGLVQNFPLNTYTLFVQPQLEHHFDSYSNVKVICTDIRWYTFKEQTIFLGLLNAENVDLMHFPHFNVPFFYRKPYIVTIHDLILIHYPDRRASTLSPLLYRIKHYAFKKILNNAVHSAQHIITVSEFSKNDIVKTLHSNPKKITVTYLGYEHIKFSTHANPIHPIPYLLFVGAQYPHKNLEFMMKVFSELTEGVGAHYDLIIAGPYGPFSETLRNKAENINKQLHNIKNGRIFCMFNLSDIDIANLYCHAKIFLFPSLYEGFGLPPLEAMAYDIPVVASNTELMKEILGDAYIPAYTYNSAEWIRAISTILTDESIRSTLKKLGQSRLTLFSFKKCISSTHTIYVNLLK